MGFRAGGGRAVGFAGGHFAGGGHFTSGPFVGGGHGFAPAHFAPHIDERRFDNHFGWPCAAGRPCWPRWWHPGYFAGCFPPGCWPYAPVCWPPLGGFLAGLLAAPAVYGPSPYIDPSQLDPAYAQPVGYPLAEFLPSLNIDWANYGLPRAIATIDRVRGLYPSRTVPPPRLAPPVIPEVRVVSTNSVIQRADDVTKQTGPRLAAIDKSVNTLNVATNTAGEGLVHAGNATQSTLVALQKAGVSDKAAQLALATSGLNDAHKTLNGVTNQMAQTASRIRQQIGDVSSQSMA